MARRSIGADVESTEGEQNAADILRFASTSIKPQAEAKGVSIESRCGAGTDLELESPDKVLQILTNLLMNGLSFSPSGGKLVASVQLDGDALKFEVSDEGPGVEAERRPSLFSAPTSTRPGGLGIGLPHSRNLARDAGGDLRLLSSDSGARFQLIWPLATKTRIRSSVPSGSAKTLSGARVLVVEDDLAIAALVELSFSARGAEVIVVSDAEEFVNVLLARPVLDLVLLDLSPVDDSLSDALDSLDQAAPGAPIILMSGQPAGIPAEAEGRFASWVRKPFDMEELLETAVGLLKASDSALLASEGSS
jgi:CheY-like chemotaxis protein